MWIIIAAAVMSWLISFRVINTYSRPVSIISEFLYRATEPLLRPIRRFLPNFGGLDISPIVVLIAIIWLIRMELARSGFDDRHVIGGTAIRRLLPWLKPN